MMYDIAWECSALGETEIDAAFVSDACIAGCQLMTLRTECPIMRNNVKWRGRPVDTSHKNRMEQILGSLRNASDKELFGSAPSSDSDMSAGLEWRDEGHRDDIDNLSSDNGSSDEEDTIMEAIFGNQHSFIPEDEAATEVPAMLHWESGASIELEPAEKMGRDIIKS